MKNGLDAYTRTGYLLVYFGIFKKYEQFFTKSYLNHQKYWLYFVKHCFQINEKHIHSPNRKSNETLTVLITFSHTV